MPKKYFKLRTIKKKAGFQLYEYLFNYGLLWDGTTDVFVLKKPRKNKVASQSGIEADAESRCPECGEAEPDLHCSNCGHSWYRTA